MSKATKRKHVTRQVLEDSVTPSDTQSIVKVGCIYSQIQLGTYLTNNVLDQVVCGRGNNLHEVETVEGETYLVTMPTRFRKNVWIKRGKLSQCHDSQLTKDSTVVDILTVLHPDPRSELQRCVWHGNIGAGGDEKLSVQFMQSQMSLTDFYDIFEIVSVATNTVLFLIMQVTMQLWSQLRRATRYRLRLYTFCIQGK